MPTPRGIDKAVAEVWSGPDQANRIAITAVTVSSSAYLEDGTTVASAALFGVAGMGVLQLPGEMTADLTQLFEQYYDSLVRMLYRRTGDRDRAEDLAQETFARAVAAPPNNPRPWLFAVALNLVREDGRKNVRQGRRLELLRADPPPATGPDEEFDRNERSAAVRSALAMLNDRDREALLLKAEGFNYQEIAVTLGLSKGAVGTTLARARRRLVEAYRSEERGKHVAS
ncbi:MAG TPA: sigma-70 family RNA polymerase sigma factor [Gemmatimonadales bacterium]|nr:sigma-70 family RNA polymerase sigma factor [Gemmatimonadales bacterium]